MGSILVVDPDLSVRRMMRSLLGGHGYTVLEARDACSAMAAFEAPSNPITVLIAPVFLAEMTGAGTGPLRPDLLSAHQRHPDQRQPMPPLPGAGRMASHPRSHSLRGSYVDLSEGWRQRRVISERRQTRCSIYSDPVEYAFEACPAGREECQKRA